MRDNFQLEYGVRRRNPISDACLSLVIPIVAKSDRDQNSNPVRITTLDRMQVHRRDTSTLIAQLRVYSISCWMLMEICSNKEFSTLFAHTRIRTQNLLCVKQTRQPLRDKNLKKQTNIFRKGNMETVEVEYIRVMSVPWIGLLTRSGKSIYTRYVQPISIQSQTCRIKSHITSSFT